ncbi:hypothetical protein [Daejeonella oryzae]|uniref:hypothetical protein n=1 Tax=Daejeonella oryzae TaxID=1122943 RepID=UPI00047B6134|nr:hypothetical protein [Daejeonella oryzae]
MIEYIKIILVKVSFVNMLFEKELIKGLRIIKSEELFVLKYWCYEKFPEMHHTVLDRIFLNVQEWTASSCPVIS